MVRKIPDDRLLLEIDVLPRRADTLPSTVFRGILEDIAEIKGLSPEDVAALNQRNIRELVGDSPRVAEITALLKHSRLIVSGCLEIRERSTQLRS